MKKTTLTSGFLLAMCAGTGAQTINNVGLSYSNTPPSFGSFNAQVQNAQDNILMLQGNNVFGNPSQRNNIFVGIGAFNGANSPIDRLHLNDISNAQATGIRLTNGNSGPTNGDGFRLALTSGLTAQLFQFENQPMAFFTNAIERMRIFAGGNVGINNTTGLNRLELTAGTGNPYFPVVGGIGSSGLRFTHLTSANNVSSGAGIFGNKVLSVDANGDVILVAPTASGGGVTCGQNGLNCSNTFGTNPGGDVEMGGNLLHTTAVGLSNFEMIFNQPGRFGVGDHFTVSVGNPPNFTMNGNNGKVVFSNGTFSSTQHNYMYLPAGSALTTVNGLSMQGRADNGGTVNGLNISIASQGNFNRGSLVDVSSNNTNTTTFNRGYQATVTNGIGTFGIDVSCSHDVSYSTNASSVSRGILVNSDFSYDNRGILSEAQQGIFNRAGYFVAEQNPALHALPYQLNEGVYAQATLGPVNVGVHGFAAVVIGNTTATTIGVYGSATSGDKVVGVYGTCPPNGNPSGGSGVTVNYAGFFNGDVVINGNTISGVSPVTLSDKRIKSNIHPIENATTILGQLSPKVYNLNRNYVSQLNVDEKILQYGLIAQEVQQVLPEVVAEVTVPGTFDKEGKMIEEAKKLIGVRYEEFIPILIKSNQEQQEVINNLQQQINELKELVKSASGATRPNTHAIELSDKNVVVLNQNVPNPFAESTVVRYNISVDFSKAQIIFSSNEGKVIKTVDVIAKGEGELNIFANDLSSGIYSYSLVIDGKVVETKKMLKQP